MSRSGPAAWSAEDRRRVPIWKIPLAGVEVGAGAEREARERETSDRSGRKSHSEPQ
jgi:hypothetical protein